MLGSENIRLAFFDMTSNMDRNFTPRLVMKLSKDIGSMALKEILDSPSFWRSWGYKNKNEAIRLIGLKSSDGSEPSSADLDLFRPLRTWAFDGQIDKEEFTSLRDDMVFRLLLSAVKKNRFPKSLLWDFVEQRRLGYELDHNDPSSEKRFGLFRKLVNEGIISKDWDFPNQDSLDIYLNFAALVFAATDTLQKEFVEILSRVGSATLQSMVSSFSRKFSPMFEGRDLQAISVTDADCKAVGIDPSALVKVRNNAFYLSLEGTVETLHDCLAVLYGSALGVLLLCAVHKRLTSEKRLEENRMAPLTIELSKADSHGEQKLRSCILS
jgi:hypothetical protein